MIFDGKDIRDRWIVRMGIEFTREWVEDRCSGMAAEIAFFGLLGLFPTLLVFASLLGWSEALIGAEAAADAEEWIVERAADIFGAESEVPDVISDLFASASPRVFTVGILVALYTASRGFAAIVRSIDVAYDEPRRRGVVGTRAVGLVLAVGTVMVGAATALLLVVGPLLGNGSDVADQIGGGDFIKTIWDGFRWPLALAILVAWAATIYHVAPNHRSPWRWELPGALLATGAWLLSTWGFTLYLSLAGEDSNAVFGLLGGAISLLLWFYVLGMGLLAGAEFNSILADWYGVGEARRTLTPIADAIRRWRISDDDTSLHDGSDPVETDAAPTDHPPIA